MRKFVQVIICKINYFTCNVEVNVLRSHQSRYKKDSLVVAAVVEAVVVGKVAGIVVKAMVEVVTYSTVVSSTF